MKGATFRERWASTKQTPRAWIDGYEVVEDGRVRAFFPWRPHADCDILAEALCARLNRGGAQRERALRELHEGRGGA